MRQTAKLRAAKTLAKTALTFPATMPDEKLYESLESLGYWWNSSAQIWTSDPRPSTSMFKDDEGNAAGIIRVRAMGMPVDFLAFMSIFKLEGWSLIEQSEPYPNRKGPGYRWYLTYKKD